MKKIAARIRYIREYLRFRKINHADGRFTVRWSDRYPCLSDRSPRSGFDKHYVYHTAWAARVLSRTRPSEHTDISSYLYFATIVSAFIPTRYYDYRPAEIFLSDYLSQQADLLNLPFEDESIQSLSCMHVIEHVGLGRYGDPMDPSGDIKAGEELVRVLSPGGTLLLVAPVGRPKVMFNAHRVYSFGQVRGIFSDLELVEFTLIPDRETLPPLIVNAHGRDADAQAYGCGCFWFRKGTGEGV
jgi:SAM-dependent methyltransferase